MPRSTRDSDDDGENKMGTRFRVLAHTTTDSPSLRRSSRIKQNRSSSVSPSSDISNSNNQSVRVTKNQTSTMDSISSETQRELRSRKLSASSDISETIDIGTPTKRITRASMSTSSLTTPTKMNTRSSTRFVRAGSETNSPVSTARITRRTRASSVDSEPLPDQSKSQPNTPIKVRRRASVLPANSPVKEESEEFPIPYVRLDYTIVEGVEPTNSASSDTTPDKSSQQSQKIREKRKSVDKIKEKNDQDTSSPTICGKSLDSSLSKLSSSSGNQDANETRKSTSKYEVTEDDSYDKAMSSSVVSQLNEIFNTSNDDIDIITVDNKENRENSNCLPNKVSRSETSQKISKKRKSINKEDVGKDDSLGQEQELEQPENKSEIYNSSMDKTMHDEKSLDKKHRIYIKSPLPDDGTTITVTEASVTNILDTSESNCNNDLINFNSSASDMEVSSSVNKKSKDQSIIRDKQSVGYDAIENSNLAKQEPRKSISKRMKESESPAKSDSTDTAETSVKLASSSSNANKATVPSIESPDLTDIAEKSSGSVAGLLPNEMEQSGIDKASDNLETDGKGNSQLEKTLDDQEIVNVIDSDSESNIGISLFSDILAGEGKSAKKDNADEDKQRYCSSSVEKEQDNESEAECDLILVDKKAWLAAESMKVTRKTAESSEYDSDDTVIKKSKLDAARANSDSTILSAINEEIPIDSAAEDVDASPSKTKTLRQTLGEETKKETDLSVTCVKDVDSSSGTDKSLDDSKTRNLDRSSDCFVSKLNKSGQVAKAARRLSESHRESDKEARDDAEKLNKSSRTDKENVPRRKSLQGRESLNKSMKDTSLRQSGSKAQDIINEVDCANKSQKESSTMKISQKEKRSLNKSCDKNNDTMEEKKSEKKMESSSSTYDSDDKTEKQASLDRSVAKKQLKKIHKPLISVTDESTSNDSEPVISAMDLKFYNYSKIGAGSIIGNLNNSEESSDTSYSNVRLTSLLFAKANSDDDVDSDTDSNTNSDVRKEYNLDGTEQKFDDDNVAHDECRASESEYSDPNDDGSDLADFIVDDDKVEAGEEEEEEKEEEGCNDEEREQEDEEQEETDGEDKQSEEKDNENEKKRKNVGSKGKDKERKKKRNAKRDNEQVAEIEECTTNEDEDADDEQSEVKIHSNDGSDESDHEDESIGIIDAVKSKKNDSVEIISSRISGTKRKQVAETRKPHMKEREETVVLDTSDSLFDDNEEAYVAKDEETISLVSPKSSSMEARRKSSLQTFAKEICQENKYAKNVSKQLMNQFVLRAPIESSTPKISSSKHRMEFDIETPKTLKKTQGSRDKSISKSDIAQNASLKRIKSRDSKLKASTSFTGSFRRDERFVDKPLNTSLPSDLIEIVRKTNLSKPKLSETTELCRTITITHTETPTIRHLRKEKLSESAPTSKLYLTADQSKKELSTTEQEENSVAKTKTAEKNDEDVANSVEEPSSNSATRKRKRQKKRKKEGAGKPLNVIDKMSLSQDTIGSEVSQKKKRVKFSGSQIADDGTSNDTLQINEEKEKKRRKRKKKEHQISVSEQSGNTEEIDRHQNDQNQAELTGHKNKATISSNPESSNASAHDHQRDAKKKSKRQETQMAPSEETSPEKASTKRKRNKRKRQEEAAAPETTVAKVKSKSSSPDNPRSQTTVSDTVEWRKAAFPGTQLGLKQAALVAEKCLVRATESKSKNRQIHGEEENQTSRATQIQQQQQNPQKRDAKLVSRKRKKGTVEEESSARTRSNLERLPDDVIKDLSNDVPTRATKRRRLSRKEKPVAVSSQSKAPNWRDASVTLSSSGGTTQFAVVNLQRIKKQSPKESTKVASFRERMLARNQREPISAYLMYLEKQRASNKKEPFNAF